MRHKKDTFPYSVVNSDAASRRTRSNHRCHVPGAAGVGVGGATSIAKTLLKADLMGNNTFILERPIVPGSEEVYLNGIRLFGSDYSLVYSGGKGVSVIINCVGTDGHDHVVVLADTQGTAPSPGQDPGQDPGQGPGYPVDNYGFPLFSEQEILYTNSRSADDPYRVIKAPKKPSGVQGAAGEVLPLMDCLYDENFGRLCYVSPIFRLDGAAFYKMDLTSVYLPKSIQFVGNSCFEDCPELEKAVVMCEGLLTFGFGVFRGCAKLKEIVLLAKNVDIPNTGVFDRTNPGLVIKVLPERLEYMRSHEVLRNYRVEALGQ